MRSDDVIADRYRLVELIGSGGMGIVWLADDLAEHRRVAMKRPHAGAGNIRADLEREAEIARRVAHPNVVEVFDVVGDGDDCWLVMEYFPATSLGAMGTLPPTQVAAVGAQVASALAAAHANDVIHRDVTPGNVLVADDGTAKVTDFGISAWRAATITSSGKISGTAAYVSPEVADGAGAKPPSDVFSLGATLFHAVEGAPPFGSGDPDAILARIRGGRAAQPTKAGPMAPVLAALLERDRAARPTAAQATDLLDDVVAGRDVPDWVPGRKRGKPLVVGLAAVVVVALVLVLWRPWESADGGQARTVLGDPRSADPCAFADASVLSGFGEATVDPNYGGFNRCDVLVDVDGGEVDVRFEFDGAGDPGTRDAVVRHSAERDEDSCDIAFTLADRSALEVVARTDDEVGTDLCAVASSAADHVTEVLRRNDQVPRRPVAAPAVSLANVDACSLITAADLVEVPTFAEATAEPGFANWDCRWRDTEGVAALRVIFDRGAGASVREGTHTVLEGRDVYLEEAGYGADTCAASVINRDYVDDSGEQRSETALVVVEGELPMPEMCTLAGTFAKPVAARLPRR